MTATTPSKPASAQGTVAPNEHGIMPCKCGSYPTLSGDGARPDDGYRTLWCQSCQKHVTEWHSSEEAAVRAWNEERELDTGATSHYSTAQTEETAIAAAPEPAASPPSPGEVLIKPLEWESKTGGCTATGLGINYAMGEEELGMFCLFHPFHSGPMPKAQVQALAQADYESRIRSALASDATANSKAGDEDFETQITLAWKAVGEEPGIETCARGDEAARTWNRLCQLLDPRVAALSGTKDNPNG